MRHTHHNSRGPTPVLPVLYLAWWVFVAAPAPALPPADYQRVDQAAGDLDPSMLGLRRVEWGLNEFGGQGTSLLMVEEPVALPGADGRVLHLNNPALPSIHRRVYYRLGQGFRARFSQPDYAVWLDRWRAARSIAPRTLERGGMGPFQEIVPSDTVYELSAEPMYVPRSLVPQAGPPREVPEKLDDADTPGWRLDGRVNGRIDARVGAGHRATPTASEGPHPARPRDGQIELLRVYRPDPADPATVPAKP